MFAGSHGSIYAVCLGVTIATAPQAVREDYYFQMFYDDLPIWGFVGKMEKIPKPHGTEHRYYLFTHGAQTC